MTKTLYFAPINRFGNYLFRNILLKNRADYVFSELILPCNIEKEIENDKFKIIKSDLNKTIFQIGVENRDEIKFIIKKISNDLELLELNKNNEVESTLISRTNLEIKEINLNMGCPQSSMQMNEICGGLLHNKNKMKYILKIFSEECKIYNILPSVKIRIGPNPECIEIKGYLKILSSSGIKKVYIHARTLKFPYSKPALYEPLTHIKEDFPDLEIIINGDVDSYNYYDSISTKIKCDGVMVGRAALQNPFIFTHIKNKITTKKKFIEFNPELNDPNIIRENQKSYLTKEKKDLIFEFLALAKNYKLRLSLIKFNLNKLIKGVTGSKKTLKIINSTKSVEQITKEIKKL